MHSRLLQQTQERLVAFQISFDGFLGAGDFSYGLNGILEGLPGFE